MISRWPLIGTSTFRHRRATEPLSRPSPPLRPPLSPPRRIEAATAVLLFLGTILPTVLAVATDTLAFNAVATPAQYALLVLSALCALGVLLLAYPLRGKPAPLYFRLALIVGILSAFASLPTAIQVLTKTKGTVAEPSPLSGRDLRGQAITDKSLGPDLRRAHLQGARLTHVSLANADLSEADLRGARLWDVEMSGANLCGADLRGADLRGARHLDLVKQWSYAYYDHHTKLPAGHLGFLEFAGPIPDTGRGLLYMCTPNDTSRISA
jgi:hypothetical protein